MTKTVETYWYAGQRLYNKKLGHLLINVKDPNKNLGFCGKIDYAWIGTLHEVTIVKEGCFTHEPITEKIDDEMSSIKMYDNEKAIEKARLEENYAINQRKITVEKEKARKDAKSKDKYENYTLKELKEFVNKNKFSRIYMREIINFILFEDK